MPIQLDDFNTGAASALGSLWTTGGGYAVSADGYAYTVDTRNPCAVFTPGPSGADQFVERKFANNNSVSMGVLTRTILSGNSVTRGYLARHNGSNIAIMRASNGSFTQIAQAGHTRAAGQTLRLESIGNQHTAFIDGVQIVTITDSTYPSGGSVGMRDGGTADSRIDSMRGGDYGVSYAGTLSLSGSGTTTPNGSPAFSSVLPLLGSGELSANGAPAFSGGLDLSGAGTSGTDASPSVSGSVPLSGSGTTTATGKPGIRSSLALAGAGNTSFSGAGEQRFEGQLALSGTGGTSFSARPAFRGSASFSGIGQLSEAGSPRFEGSLYVDGAGQLVLVGSAEQVPTGFTPYRVDRAVDENRRAAGRASDTNRIEVFV